MEDRKSFVMKVATGMATAGFMPVTERNSSKTRIKNVFVHHVLFWLKEPENQVAGTQFEKGLNDLVAVPLIKSSHIGKPVESQRDVVDGSFTYSLITFFNSKEDENAYQTHPMHLKFVEDCQHLWEKVIVYDAMD